MTAQSRHRIGMTGWMAVSQRQRGLELCAIYPDQPFDFGEPGYFLPRDVVLKQFVDPWLHIAIESGVWTRLMQTYQGP